MIVASHLRKLFKVYRKPADRLKEVISGRKHHTEHLAINDVSFQVEQGQVLSIIGPNGAGKSTLLKILSGVLLPDSGTYSVDGRVTGLLELGTGFNYDLSGQQNIFANAYLLGMSHAEVEASYSDIVAFAEIGDFIAEPLKTYSTGMLMRLGFAIAIHARPVCFIVDEALAVGDAYFQQKCIQKLKEFKAGGGAIVFVSHDLSAVKLLSDKVMLLHQGQVLEIGDPDQVVNSYNFLLTQFQQNFSCDFAGSKRQTSYGNYSATIDKVAIRSSLSGAEVISSGENAVITVELTSHANLPDLVVGILVRDKFGQDVFGTNTYHLDQRLSVASGERLSCRFSMEMNIAPGKYTLTVALHTQDHHLDNCMHWVDNILDFEIAGIMGSVFAGLCRLTPEVDITRNPA